MSAGSWKNRILSALISTRNNAQNADIMWALAWRSSGDCAGTTRSSAYPRFCVKYVDPRPAGVRMG